MSEMNVRQEIQQTAELIKAEEVRSLSEFFITFEKYREQFGLALKKDDYI